MDKQKFIWSLLDGDYSNNQKTWLPENGQYKICNSLLNTDTAPNLKKAIDN